MIFGMESLEKSQLERLLEYRDENVISRFTDTFDLKSNEAEDILKETLKFLYISQVPGVFISDDLLILDEMWHNMILFTPQYHEFGQQHFMRYVHHVPASKSEKEDRQCLLQQQPEVARQEYLDKLEVLIAITYDYLGKETVKKWFQEYPKRYSKENIKALRR